MYDDNCIYWFGPTLKVLSLNRQVVGFLLEENEMMDARGYAIYGLGMPLTCYTN